MKKLIKRLIIIFIILFCLLFSKDAQGQAPPSFTQSVTHQALLHLKNRV